MSSMSACVAKMRMIRSSRMHCTKVFTSIQTHDLRISFKRLKSDMFGSACPSSGRNLFALLQASTQREATPL